MRRLRWTPLLTIAAAVAVGCGTSTEGPGPVVGEYTLEGRDGVALPIRMLNGDTLISGTLTMRDDSTFTSVPTYRNGPTRQYSNNINGTWSVSGSALSYRSATYGEIATGAFGRGWVTFVQSGSYRFVRR